MYGNDHLKTMLSGGAAVLLTMCLRGPVSTLRPGGEWTMRILDVDGRRERDPEAGNRPPSIACAAILRRVEGIMDDPAK